MNWSITLRLRAPMARRMPISRVRSVTLTSMMFMMPMPAAIRAMLLMAATPSRMAEVRLRNWLTADSLETISKSSSSPGATRRIARMTPRACSTISA